VTTIYRAAGCITPRCVACYYTRPACCSVVRSCTIGIVTEDPAPTDPSGRFSQRCHVTPWSLVYRRFGVICCLRALPMAELLPYAHISEIISIMIRIGRLPSGLPTRLLRATCLAHLILLDAKGTSHEAPCCAVSSNLRYFQQLR
jgi:hypothetical protein